MAQPVKLPGKDSGAKGTERGTEGQRAFGVVAEARQTKTDTSLLGRLREARATLKKYGLLGVGVGLAVEAVEVVTIVQVLALLLPGKADKLLSEWLPTLTEHFPSIAETVQLTLPLVPTDVVVALVIGEFSFPVSIPLVLWITVSLGRLGFSWKLGLLLGVVSCISIMVVFGLAFESKMVSEIQEQFWKNNSLRLKQLEKELESIQECLRSPSPSPSPPPLSATRALLLRGRSAPAEKKCKDPTAHQQELWNILNTKFTPPILEYAPIRLKTPPFHYDALPLSEKTRLVANFEGGVYGTKMG